MFLFKKLVLSSCCVTSFLIPGIHYLIEYEKFNQEKQNLIFKNFDKWFVSVGETSDKEKVKKLFENNLTSFSNFLSESIAEKIIYNWAKNFLLNDSSNKMLKNEIQKLFNEQKHEIDLKTLDLKHQNQEYWNIKHNSENLKKIFKKFLLINLFSWDSSTQIDNSYDKFLHSIQNFIFDAWIKEEKPFHVMEKTWKYSTTPPNNIYKAENIKDINSSSYKWPDFITDETYADAIDKLKNNKINELKYDAKIYTLSDLKTITDGYKLSSLIYKYSDIKTNNSTAAANTSDSFKELDLNGNTAHYKDKFTTNPIYLFLDKEETSSPDDKCIKIQKAWFEDDFLKKNDTDKSSANNDYCIHGIRNIKNGATNAPANTYSVTFNRNLEGVTLFIVDKNYDRTQLKNTIKKDKESAIYKNFANYWESNFDVLLSKYYVDKSKNDGYLELNSLNDDDKLKETIKETHEYLSALNQNKNYLNLLNILSKTVTDFQLLSYESVSGKHYLAKQHGLITPLYFKRQLDKTTEIATTIDLKSNYSEGNTKNHGKFEKLFDSYFSNLNLDNLYKKSKTLKEKINSLFEILKFESKSFSDYTLDSLLYKFLTNSKIMSTYISNLYISKHWNLDVMENPTVNLDNYANKVIEILKNSFNFSDSEIAANNIKTIVEELFFIPTYISTPLHQKLNFGGYKPVSGSNNSIKTKSKNAWIMENYFFNDFGYELSSDNISKYLIFLDSIAWLLNNNEKNLKNIVYEIFSSKQTGFLVWIADLPITSTGTNSQPADNNVITKEFEKKFTQEESDEIFDPFFNLTTFKTLSATNTTIKRNNNLLSANAYKESSDKKNLFGFHGLQTSNFSTLNIPEYIKKAIFEEFAQSNDSENKNYSDSVSASGTSSSNTSKDIIPGFYFGINFQSHEKDFDSLIISQFFAFNKHEELNKYIEHGKKTNFNTKLNTYISDQNMSKSLRDMTVSEIKATMKSAFVNISEEEKKEFKRFSGYIKNIEGNVGATTNSASNYELSDPTNSKIKKYVFVQQINKFDFLLNIKNLKNSIDPETIIKTLYSLANTEKIIKIMKDMKIAELSNG